jgi:hypothetical protein
MQPSPKQCHRAGDLGQSTEGWVGFEPAAAGLVPDASSRPSACDGCGARSRAKLVIVGPAMSLGLR